jgi:hypothetical protein
VVTQASARSMAGIVPIPIGPKIATFFMSDWYW